MPYPGEHISIVEDMDPVPSRRGSWQGWEVALGISLLVGVLAFASWQGFRQDQQESNYAAGKEAVASRDWDGAHARFAAASGYRDADKQAQAVAATIAERDEQYNIAVSDEQTGEWAACLKSIQQVMQIEPGYKDAARLETSASKHVYQDAISGTVALRPSATPPGLYYYGVQGWQWLPRSDRYSQVRANSHLGRLLYDVPGSIGSGYLTGHRLLVVQPPDMTDIRQLEIDPAQFGGYILGDSGVWALRYSSKDSFSGPSLIRSALVGVDEEATTYESFTGIPPSRVKLPAAGDSALMAFDLNSDRYLVAGWSGAGDNSSVMPGTQSTLYVGEMGVEPRPVYRLQSGSFESAEMSPDGRHALLNIYIPLDAETEKQSVLSIDLQGAEPSQILAEAEARRTGSNARDMRAWVSSTYLRGGEVVGEVALAQYDGAGYHVRVMDVGRSSKALVDVAVPDSRRLT